MAQTTRNMSAVREICVQSLGWEDPLEANGSHSSILGWEIPWTEQPGGLQSLGLQESDMIEQLTGNQNFMGILENDNLSLVY